MTLSYSGKNDHQVCTECVNQKVPLGTDRWENKAFINTTWGSFLSTLLRGRYK